MRSLEGFRNLNNDCAGRSSCVITSNGTVGVLVGNGDGTFQTAMTYSSGVFGAFSVAVPDVNGDRKPDLVVANFCSSSDCNNGTFQTPLTYGAGHWVRIGRKSSVPLACLTSSPRP